jgi:putative endonuclease
MKIIATYILECANETYYVGSTNDLWRRIEEHQLGLGSNYTRKHLPVKLVFYQEFSRIDEAFERECQIKKWTSKKKKALINSDKTSLKELSRGKDKIH